MLNHEAEKVNRYICLSILYFVSLLFPADLQNVTLSLLTPVTQFLEFAVSSA